MQSAEWKALLRAAGVHLYDSVVEGHNSLGAGERYHAYLRNSYNRVSAGRPGISADIELALAVFVMKQTAGPSGFSPMLSRFGVSPPVPVKPVNLSSHHERSKAKADARQKMGRCAAKARLDAARRNKVPSGAMVDEQLGIDVLVFREVPDKKCEGPDTVVGVSGKSVWLKEKQRLRMYSITKFKVYNPPPKKKPTDQVMASVEHEMPPVATAPADSTSYKSTIVDSIIAGDTLVTNVLCAMGQLRDKADCGASSAMQTPQHV